MFEGLDRIPVLQQAFLEAFPVAQLLNRPWAIVQLEEVRHEQTWVASFPKHRVSGKHLDAPDHRKLVGD